MPGGPDVVPIKGSEPEPEARPSPTASSQKSDQKSTESTMAEKAKQAYEAAKPYLDQLVPILHAMWPFCVMAKDSAKQVYSLLQPYYNEDVGNCILGVVLLFLGGNFAMTIACYQIFMASGQRMMSKSWRELQENFQESMAKLNNDPDMKLLDKDGDGKLSPVEVFRSITELTQAQTPDEKVVAYKKISLLMKCVDPSKIWEGLLGLWTGIVAMLAALRSRFIRALTVGANLGKNAVEIMAPYLRPKLYSSFPGHTQWVDFGLKASGGIFGAVVSMLLIRIINSFNAAVEGAKILVDLAIVVAKKNKKIDDENFLDSKLPANWKQGAIWILASIGFCTQFQAGFSLPFLLKVPLLPVLFVEGVLGMLASVSPV